MRADPVGMTKIAVTMGAGRTVENSSSENAIRATNTTVEVTC